MLIKSKKSWELSEVEATDETVFIQRRGFIKRLAAGTSLVMGMGVTSKSATANVKADLFPARRNNRYKLDRQISSEKLVTSYNNFYEFGSHKKIAAAAQALKTHPWSIKIDGLVETDLQFDVDELFKLIDFEERLYRFRCVEAWSMNVPWTGFPMAALVRLARPNSQAKFVVMKTFMDPSVAGGQRQFWYPWPYVEALTLEEATNELTFIGTGAYGKSLPKQMGAPLRLVVPWKYGFKSIKSIISFTFTRDRPKTFWENVQPKEYGFWANVNPLVDHPRWSQRTEKPLGKNNRVETLPFNGYQEYVAHIYENIKGEQLFR